MYKLNCNLFIESVVIMSQTVKFSNRLFSVAANQVITIAGKTAAIAEAFEIKLTNANDILDIGNVCFNFSVNFKTNEIIRNSQIDGKWGKEEKSENLLGSELNPVKKGHNFTISIEVYAKVLIVFIDESPFCTFALRRPLNEIQKIVIVGDVEKVFGVDHEAKDRNGLQVNENQIWRGLIPRIFDNAVVFTAVPKNGSGNFNVNFRQLMTTPILMQLKVDFDSTGIGFKFQDTSSKTSVSNSSTGFVVNKPFKLGIGFAQSKVIIAVNGQQTGKFDFSKDKSFDKVRALEVLKDVNLNMEASAVDFFRIKEADMLMFANFTKL